MLFTDNKGLSKISVVFFSLVFVIIWALFIAEQVTTWGNVAIINGGLTGIEALLYGNINLIIGLIFLMFILGVSVFGGSQY